MSPDGTRTIPKHAGLADGDHADSFLPVNDEGSMSELHSFWDTERVAPVVSLPQTVRYLRPWCGQGQRETGTTRAEQSYVGGER